MPLTFAALNFKSFRKTKSSVQKLHASLPVRPGRSDSYPLLSKMPLKSIVRGEAASNYKLAGGRTDDEGKL